MGGWTWKMMFICLLILLGLGVDAVVRGFVPQAGEGVKVLVGLALGMPGLGVAMAFSRWAASKVRPEAIALWVAQSLFATPGVDARAVPPQCAKLVNGRNRGLPRDRLRSLRSRNPLVVEARRLLVECATPDLDRIVPDQVHMHAAAIGRLIERCEQKAVTR